MKSITRHTLLIGAFSLVGGGIVGVGIDSATAGPAVQAQVAPESVPSSFVPIDPYRSFDSRRSADNISGEGTRFANGEIRTIVADEDLGGNQVVPDEATAVTYNVTVTDTTGAGFVEVTTGNQEPGSTSSANWTEAGQIVANSGSIALADGSLVAERENTFAIRISDIDAEEAHVIIDITGFYVPA